MQREGDIAIGALTANSVYSIPVADMAFRSRMTSLISRIIKYGAASEGAVLSDAAVESMAEDIMITSEKSNQTTYQELQAAFVTAKEDGDGLDVAAKMALLVLLIKKVFARRRRASRKTSEAIVTGSYNYGAHTAALSNGKITKTWVSQRDSRVRPAHRSLDGSSVPIDHPFHVDGVPIRFPGDPLAPIHLIIQCRCFLRYGIS